MVFKILGQYFLNLLDPLTLFRTQPKTPIYIYLYDCPLSGLSSRKQLSNYPQVYLPK